VSLELTRDAIDDCIEIGMKECGYSKLQMKPLNDCISVVLMPKPSAGRDAAV